MSLYVTALTTMIPALEFIWSHRDPFPPTPSSATALAFLLIFFGRWTYRRTQQALGEKDPLRLWYQVLTFTVLCGLLFPAWRKNGYVHFHPIDMLMYDAKIHHDKYLNEVGNLTSLTETVIRY